MIIDFLKKVYQIWVEERPTQLAAALAYYAMFSLAPVIFIAFSIAGILINNIALAERVSATLEEILGPEMVQTIQSMIATISIDLPDQIEQYTWLSSVIGFLALLWAASGLFNQIHFALNRLWQVPILPKNKTLGTIRYRLLSFLIVIFFGLLLVIISIVNGLLSWIDSIYDVPSDYSLFIFLTFVSLTTLCFAIIYKLFPDVRLRWRDVWLGAGIAAFLEALGFLLIGLLIQFGLFTSPSAAAGSVAMLLVIAYYMAQIFLLGAVITRVFTTTRGSQSPSHENG
jgi:membrane protein